MTQGGMMSLAHSVPGAVILSEKSLRYFLLESKPHQITYQQIIINGIVSG